MKSKLLIFIILFSFCSSLKAQVVYLPDTAWRNFLLTQGLSSCIIGDSLNTTCPAILNVNTLDCTLKNIFDVSGIEHFTNLISFTCKFNSITSLDNLPQGLQSLNCERNRITELDSLPTSLTTLYCGGNQIQSINSILDSLISLNCDDNQLTSLSQIYISSTLKNLSMKRNLVSGPFYPPSTLITLDIQSNQITFLGTLPSNLNFLNCGVNPLNYLPQLPNSLTQLVCWFNNLTFLPTLPTSLVSLTATDNSLSNLPQIPSSLRFLNISDNQLSTLPLLPDSLNNLSISNNQFTALPLLPSKLLQLSFSRNNISTIDSLPADLYLLRADSCQLTTFPDCPPRMNDLVLSYNNIQTIGSLPDSLWRFEIDHNPISCLPPIEILEYFNLKNTNIHCLPNRIQFSQSDIDPDTIPLCDIISGCPVNWNIRGQVNHDLNLDCTHDSSENFLKEIPIILKSNGIVRQISYSTKYGEYSFKAPFGSYFVLVDTASEPFNYNCPVGGYSSISISAADSIVDSLDFHLKCRPIDDKLVKSISPYEAFRPGRPTRVDINAGDASTYHGTTCFNNAGTVYAILSPNVSFTGPAPNALSPNTINGDTLIWNISDFSTVIPSRDFNLQLMTDTTTSIGDSICIQVLILPSNDFDSTNNIIQECFPVRTSFDPNEKWVSPEVADTSDHTFTYTILFQNTGNASAYNIFIIDTIDTDLNASSFELLGSSHNMTTQIFPGNIIRFNFNAIELPDSVNDEPNSHGFVKFRINRKANTGAGTEITNTAFIYFDYNSPIATNTTRVEINSPVGINDPVDNKIELYPNPAGKSITIRSENIMNEIQIHDIYGKNVLSKLSVNSNDINLSLNELKPGLYFVKIISVANKQITKKLIIH